MKPAMLPRRGTVGEHPQPAAKSSRKRIEKFGYSSINGINWIGGYMKKWSGDVVKICTYLMHLCPGMLSHLAAKRLLLSEYTSVFKSLAVARK